jgi:RimJ/RimL family protein N-acetyltransferase
MAASPLPIITALLEDGRPVGIRPIEPTDAPAHEAFVMGLSPESRYLRFFGPKPRVTAAEEEHFCTVDHVDREALIGIMGDQIVGVARYERIAPTTAEAAFAVADALHGMGLGTLLLEQLAEAGRRNGIQSFTAEVLAGNARMMQVFGDSGFVMTTHYESGGTVHVELDLQPTEALRAAMDARHRHAAEAAREE